MLFLGRFNKQIKPNKCAQTTYIVRLRSYATGHLLPSQALNYLTAVLMREEFTLAPFVPSRASWLSTFSSRHRCRRPTAGQKKKKTPSEQWIGFCLGKPDPHPVRKLSSIAGPRLLLRFCSLLLSLSFSPSFQPFIS